MTNKTKLKKIFSRKPKKTAEELNSELITASCNSDVKQVAKLLKKHNLDVNFQCKKWHGRTALLCATNMNIINLLIDAGADVNAQCNEGNTVLHWACRCGNIEFVKVLLENGADINRINDVKNQFGSTPLKFTKKINFNGSYDDVIQFLEDYKNHKKTQILKEAVPDKEKLKEKLKEAIFTNYNYGRSIDERYNDIKKLIEDGVDVNAEVSDIGMKALIVAACGGYIKIIKLLLDAGADVNAKDNFGWTALHCVREVDIAKLLIKAGADINAKNNFGVTPLGTVKSSLNYEYSNAEDLAKVVKFLEDYLNTKSNKTLKEPMSDKQKGASEIKFIDRGGITTKGISSSRWQH